MITRIAFSGGIGLLAGLAGAYFRLKRGGILDGKLGRDHGYAAAFRAF